MTVYIGSYHEAFRAAFKEVYPTYEAAERFEADIKKIADEVIARIVERIEDDIRGRFLENMRDAVCAKAAEVAAQMIESALTGDQNEIRRIFGFYEHRPGDEKHLALWGHKPTAWGLINAIVAANPAVFQTEALRQRDETILALEDERKKLIKNQNDLAEQLAVARGYA